MNKQLLARLNLCYHIEYLARRFAGLTDVGMLRGLRLLQKIKRKTLENLSNFMRALFCFGC